MKHPAIGAGYLKTGSWLETDNAPEAELESTEGAVFGTVLPLPFGGFLTDRLALGFAAFFPRGVFAELDVPAPDVPQYVLLRNSGQQATLAPSMSIRLHDALAVGGGAELFSNTDGEINAIVDANGDIQTLTGQEVYTSFAPIAGLMFRPGEIWTGLRPLSFGFVFREEFFTHYRIPINSYVGSTPITLIFDATSLYTPRQWTAGLAFQSEAYGFTAEFDASYNEWSGFPDPNLFVDVAFEVPLIGVGFADSEQLDPGFKDTVTLRTGVEKHVFDTPYFGFLAQGGYFYDPSPVPAQTGITNYLDTDRHVFSGGLAFDVLGVGAWRFDGPITVQATGQYHYLVPRRFHKDTNVPSDNPGYPEIGFSGSIWAVAFDISFAFDYY
ncbi:MAG: hypothetical protein M5R36_12260 [Deltaproteobacteria bacterium]|nr:hypothetical protein [Deltaproteobacteria bacterium]